MSGPRLPVLLLGSALAACSHFEATAEAPARLVDPSPTVRAELEAALVEALGASPAALADDALVDSSQLILERAALASRGNSALTGRTLEPATERFVLVRAGTECVLTRPSDGWRRSLPAARCEPE
jgi:hypothetical protein